MKISPKILAAIVLPFLTISSLTYCKETKKDDKRNSNEGTLPSDDLTFDDFGPVAPIKADALTFDHDSEINLEPMACVAFDLIVIGGEDAFFASLEEDTTISVTSTSKSTEFFTDNQCKNVSSEVLLAKGNSYGSIFIREKNPGTITLKAETTKGAKLKTAEAKVVFAKASKLKFLTLVERDFALDRCEPISLILKSQDDKDVLTAAPIIITLAVTNGAGKFYSAENCSGDPTLTKELPKGYSDSTIFVRATNLGPLTLQAQAPKDSGYESATLTINVAPKE